MTSADSNAQSNDSSAASLPVPVAPVIIEGVAVEEPASAGEAAAAETSGNARIRAWMGKINPAIAASLFLGLGSGIGGAALFAKRSADAHAVFAATSDLKTRLVAIEHARANEEGTSRATIATLNSELEKARATSGAKVVRLTARVDKLDQEMVARLEKIEKSLAARDLTAAITPQPTAAQRASADKAAQELAARVEKLEKALVSRDATASIQALPPPPAPPAPNVAGKPNAHELPAAAPLPPVSERGRVQTGGWVLRSVSDGVALVEGAIGVYEVEPGDILPGVGKVRSIERRAGQWVVVTSAGYIDRKAY